MTKPANFEKLSYPQVVRPDDDTLANENGVLADGSLLRKIVIAAAIHNPYAGGFSGNLGPDPG